LIPALTSVSQKCYERTTVMTEAHSETSDTLFHTTINAKPALKPPPHC